MELCFAAMSYNLPGIKVETQRRQRRTWSRCRWESQAKCDVSLYRLMHRESAFLALIPSQARSSSMKGKVSTASRLQGLLQLRLRGAGAPEVIP